MYSNCRANILRSPPKSMSSELSPEAPIYVPPPLRNARNSPKTGHVSAKSTPSPPTKEPQCSRYSRKTIRHTSAPNTPRPILGTKSSPFPRAILGRKSESDVDNKENVNIGNGVDILAKKLSELDIKEADKKKNK